MFPEGFLVMNRILVNKLDDEKDVVKVRGCDNGRRAGYQYAAHTRTPITTDGLDQLVVGSRFMKRKLREQHARQKADSTELGLAQWDHKA